MAEEEAKRRDLQERLTPAGAISNAYPLIISLNLSHDTLKFVYIRPGLMLSIGGQQSYSELYADMAPSIHEDHREHFKQRLRPNTFWLPWAEKEMKSAGNINTCWRMGSIIGSLLKSLR